MRMPLRDDLLLVPNRDKLAQHHVDVCQNNGRRYKPDLTHEPSDLGDVHFGGVWVRGEQRETLLRSVCKVLLKLVRIGQGLGQLWPPDLLNVGF